MIRAVLFDFDGVIVESADIKTEAFRSLFEEEYPEKADEIVAYHLSREGVSRYDKFHHIYEQILGLPYSDELGSELGARFSGIALDRILEAPFVPGAVEFLSRHRDHYLLCVVSGTPQEELDHIVRERGIYHLFHELHGTPRPKVEIIEDIASRHRLMAEEMVLVGDAESDLRAARETGLTFIARQTPGGERFASSRYRLEDLTGLDAVITQVGDERPRPVRGE